MKNLIFFICLIAFISPVTAQDSTVQVGKKFIVLTPVVVNNKLNAATFINLIKNDSTFYKAFRNLHLLGFSAINDIRMLDGKGNSKASLNSKTRQYRKGSCRYMETQEETSTGDFYTSGRQYNYYTAQMYASLFFTRDSVCGEDNFVTGKTFSTEGLSGMEKHKQQLKMLFFNPGRRISGIPFISSKTEIYSDDMAGLYNMSIDMQPYHSTNCYVFRQKVKPGHEDDVVLDEMTTWFNDSSLEVVARNYTLSYSALVYDFKVQMEVEMTHYQQYLVPCLIRYTGNWKAIFKKRERGVFTATLFDFH